MSTAIKLQVLGQAAGLPFEEITVDHYRGLVTLDVTGPDGAAHATLTPGRAADLISMLQEAIRHTQGADDGT